MTITLRGDKVYCPMCQWQGKYFVNHNCPNCGSIPRLRLLGYGVEKHNLSDSEKVLHIAPNMAEFKYVSSTFIGLKTYDRLDIKERKQINVAASLTDTGLRSNFYDSSIIWHVLEHIPEDIKAISELYRVLKLGAKLLVSVPIYPIYNPTTVEDPSVAYKDYKETYGHYDHCRACGYDYYKRFEEAGFKTVDTIDVRHINQSIKSEYGLVDIHVAWCFEK
ncbi:methyltransferase domain-containing protein [Winogradskyella sp. A3E31]|uniref:methyltransferase domain-containing protein n=1 Tax=Winogradskyella sp. A3E31 TaxID=3349637 RepID=UPI00398AE1B8